MPFVITPPIPAWVTMQNYTSWGHREFTIVKLFFTTSSPFFPRELVWWCVGIPGSPSSMNAALCQSGGRSCCQHSTPLGVRIPQRSWWICHHSATTHFLSPGLSFPSVTWGVWNDTILTCAGFTKPHGQTFYGRPCWSRFWTFRLVPGSHMLSSLDMDLTGK